jgi:2-C-methyl-D-erythritol 4-phosphate cytidylyltransferase
MNSEKVVAIVPAAGSGIRMGTPVRKQFISVRNRPILSWTLLALHRIHWIHRIILIVPESQIPFTQTEILNNNLFHKVSHVVAGGAERQDSVYSGLREIRNGEEWILVHDGVRPFIREESVREVLKKAYHTGAATLAVPVQETLKRVSSLRVISTEDRQHFWLIQTPQIFKKSVLMEAYAKALNDGFYGTDDATLVERAGTAVFVAQGDNYNLKITSPEDLKIAEQLLPLYFPEFFSGNS